MYVHATDPSQLTVWCSQHAWDILFLRHTVIRTENASCCCPHHEGIHMEWEYSATHS